MSYELIGILLLGLGEIAAIVHAERGLREMQRTTRETQRMTRAVAGLIVQESGKIQDLLKD